MDGRTDGRSELYRRYFAPKNTPKLRKEILELEHRLIPKECLIISKDTVIHSEVKD
jgi:hypothetical protein